MNKQDREYYFQNRVMRDIGKNCGNCSHWIEHHRLKGIGSCPIIEGTVSMGQSCPGWHTRGEK